MLIKKCRPYFIDSFEKFQPLIVQQINWDQKVLKSIDLQKLSNILSKLKNPLIDISNMWINNYSDIFEKIRETLDKLQSIPEFDFSRVNEEFKNACMIMLKNGFYPNRRMNVSMVKITKIKNKKQLNEFISNRIEHIVFRDETRIKTRLSHYRNIINQIFSLYRKEEYRLCILSIINLLSIIYNNNFDNTDFNQQSLNRKLTNLGLVNDNQDKFSIFAPYYVKERNDNKIIASYQNTPLEYKKYPYCRNAILHGYSIRFGNKRNALRWFSVLLNTIDLLEAVEEINSQS